MNIAMSILHNQADAEDALQNAFIAIAKNIDKLSDANSKQTEAYVCLAAKNRALNMLPKKRQRDKLINIEYTNEKSYENVIFDYFNMENYKNILKCIEKLEPVYKDVLSLYYIYEMKPSEISITLERKISTVKSQLSRGQKKLIQLLKEEKLNEQYL
jgi:RNA polymerase sigma-70 factor (ECF subfamily)